MNWKPLVMGGAALAGLNHLMNRPGNRAVGDLDDGVVELDNFYSVEKLIYQPNRNRHGYDGPDNAHVGDFVVLAHFGFFYVPFYRLLGPGPRALLRMLFGNLCSQHQNIN